MTKEAIIVGFKNHPPEDIAVSNTRWQQAEDHPETVMSEQQSGLTL